MIVPHKKNILLNLIDKQSGGNSTSTLTSSKKTKYQKVRFIAWENWKILGSGLIYGNMASSKKQSVPIFYELKNED